MDGFPKRINVAKPYMPPLEEFCDGLKEIWESQWLTNHGPVLRRYEEALQNYFDTGNMCLFTNGTLALQIALQGMRITGEVITTPFTFVATTHALIWNNLRPVFCDIEPEFFTIDPDKVERLITPSTTAILAVHVFGRPCNLDALAAIARRHNLILIYDAAHAFGVKVNGQAICHFGDLSMFSFHATKIYHTMEGGALVFKNPSLLEIFDYLKNFGFKNETEVVMPGSNAKMSEMQALMGLLMLEHVEKIVAHRKRLYQIYKKRLKDIPGIVFSPDPSTNITYNYAYVPIQVDGEEFGMSRDELYERLKDYNVFTRRYFYPLVTDFACYSYMTHMAPLSVAQKVAGRILNLPIYMDLQEEEVSRIADIIIHLHKRYKCSTSIW